MRAILLAVLIGASPAYAEPIEQTPEMCFHARWVPSRATDCSNVCRTVNLAPEHMPMSGARGAASIFVCRHRNGPEWNYGTQSSGNCRAVVGSDVPKHLSFECLCARRVRC